MIAVGQGQDETLSRIVAIGDPKIRVIETEWNENMRDRGFVYGQQKMIAQYNCTGDWAFYLEGDEVLHEDELPAIQDTMEQHLNDPMIEALYFNFFISMGRLIRSESQAIERRLIIEIRSSIAPDGLFFVVLDKNKHGRYPRAVSANANIYHYGHCRSVSKMNEKLAQVGRYWGGSHEEFQSYGNIDVAELREFTGTHPAVMSEWLAHEAEHVFEQVPGYSLSRRDYRNRVRFWLEDMLGVEISKKHYRRMD